MPLFDSNFCPRFGKYPPLCCRKKESAGRSRRRIIFTMCPCRSQPPSGFFYWCADFLGLGCRDGERLNGMKCYTLFWKLGRSWTCKMGGVLQTVAGILHFLPGVVSFTTCKGNDNGVILQDFRHNLQECALWAFFCVARPARRAWLVGRGWRENRQGLRICPEVVA